MHNIVIQNLLDCKLLLSVFRRILRIIIAHITASMTNNKTPASMILLIGVGIILPSRSSPGETVVVLLEKRKKTINK